MTGFVEISVSKLDRLSKEKKVSNKTKSLFSNSGNINVIRTDLNRTSLLGTEDTVQLYVSVLTLGV